MGKKLKIYICYHLPWQLLAATIFTLSSIPGEDLPDIGIRAADKLAHFVIFGVLAVFLYRSFSRSARPDLRKFAASMGILITILYGVLDELHQFFIPGRTPSILDWIADLTGAVLFVLIYRILQRKVPALRKNRES